MQNFLSHLILVRSQMRVGPASASIDSNGENPGFTLIEMLVVIAIISILAALLLSALSQVKSKGQQTVCLSNLKQIGVAFEIYGNDQENRFPDRRELKLNLPSGFRTWSSWPLSDPRGGWAAVALSDSGARAELWSCPAAINSPVGNVVQSLQQASTNVNPPIVRYWLWRFDRTDNPPGLTLFWGKTHSQAVSDLQIANDANVGPINGTMDVELAVDSYFPNTISTVSSDLKGRTIHRGGRCRVFLDGHTQFIRDSRTPLE
jgi:prepilin-type N-terminal cleavage/methylation domain-containing protein